MVGATLSARSSKPRREYYGLMSLAGTGLLRKKKKKGDWLRNILC
jgi:hypothetical protein